MGAYLFRRVIRAVVVVAGVSFISFSVLFLSGDPTDTMVGEDWTVQEVKQLRQDMGLDKPWFVQYGRYVGRAVQGDFGESLRYRQPAFELIMERLPATLELALVALVLSIILAFPLGVVSATQRGSPYDHGGMLFALLGQSMPVFWLGLDADPDLRRSFEVAAGQREKRLGASHIARHRAFHVFDRQKHAGGQKLHAGGAPA